MKVIHSVWLASRQKEPKLLPPDRRRLKGRGCVLLFYRPSQLNTDADQIIQGLLDKLMVQSAFSNLKDCLFHHETARLFRSSGQGLPWGPSPAEAWIAFTHTRAAFMATLQLWNFRRHRKRDLHRRDFNFPT